MRRAVLLAFLAPLVLALLTGASRPVAAACSPSGPGSAAVYGYVYGFPDHSDQFVALYGATVSASPGGASATSQANGYYCLALPAGAYALTAFFPSPFKAETFSVALADGGISQVNFYLLDPPATAVPEFPAGLVVPMVLAFAVGFVLLRLRRPVLTSRRQASRG